MQQNTKSESLPKWHRWYVKEQPVQQHKDRFGGRRFPRILPTKKK